MRDTVIWSVVLSFVLASWYLTTSLSSPCWYYFAKYFRILGELWGPESLPYSPSTFIQFTLAFDLISSYLSYVSLQGPSHYSTIFRISRL
ncbi:hypothetical protein L873DRAFT_83033 [Choiromyces venosus 120613-1]|uniref:Uncharacterized protein n=1 Tax=Choiromyces venosus 120613-1 TaxID=1336337 RepID=A0A3N4J4C9_9PEZI|nr:hypothetical protein L873DRAFT_83033 [Choiromyces venosus 120613-1]